MLQLKILMLWLIIPILTYLAINKSFADYTTKK